MHVDLGSGDGKGPYRWALQNPDSLYIATDLNISPLLETAKRAARKPSRGGVSNMVCLAESLDVLAAELPGFANEVTAVLPWGSLLRALVLPDSDQLAYLHNLCAPDAGFSLVISYDPARDMGEFRRLGFGEIGHGTLTNGLAGAYELAGFQMFLCEPLGPAALASFETTWAKRLAHGAPRPAWRLRFGNRKQV